jgi:hypothetical protein
MHRSVCSDSITPLPLYPEMLGELVEKLPTGAIEQLTHKWQKQTEALAHSERENRLSTRTLASDAAAIIEWGCETNPLHRRNLSSLAESPSAIISLLSGPV